LYKKISILYNKNCNKYAQACNDGSRLARGDYFLFLSNDTIVKKGWLFPLVSILDNDLGVAAVGGKHLFLDRKIQHAGFVITKNPRISQQLIPEPIFYLLPENLLQANIARTCQALSSACLLVRKTAYDLIQRLDEGYFYGYEDIDLCFQFREKGWSLVYEPSSTVFRLVSKNTLDDILDSAKFDLERLNKKWLDKIEPDYLVNDAGKRFFQHASCYRPYKKIRQLSSLKKLRFAKNFILPRFRELFSSDS
jgi:GT2 family glycosyltransferase